MIISCSALVAIIFGYIFLFFTRKCAGVLIWTIILGIIFLLGALAAFFFLAY